MTAITANTGFFFNDPINPTSAVDIAGATVLVVNGTATVTADATAADASATAAAASAASITGAQASCTASQSAAAASAVTAASSASTASTSASTAVSSAATAVSAASTASAAAGTANSAFVTAQAAATAAANSAAAAATSAASVTLPTGMELQANKGAASGYAALDGTKNLLIGSTNVAGSYSAKYRSAGLGNDYDAQITASGGASGTLGGGVLSLMSTQHNVVGNDGSVQFRVLPTIGSVEFVQTQGGTVGQGGTLYATNGTASGNVDLNYATQGTGSHWFGGGAGILFQIADPGSEALTYPIIKAGTSTTGPSYSSNGTTTIDATSGNAIRFVVGGVVCGSIANSKSIGSTTNFPQFYANTTSVGFQATNLAGTGAVSAFIQAQSTGQVSFGNASGSLATFANSDANTAVDFVVLKASSTTQVVRLTTGAGTSVAIGTGSLAAGATTGFLGIPIINAAPTGTPTPAGAGFAFICYNQATKKINVYDTANGGWFSTAALTSGAG